MMLGSGCILQWMWLVVHPDPLYPLLCVHPSPRLCKLHRLRASTWTASRVCPGLPESAGPRELGPWGFTSPASLDNGSLGCENPAMRAKQRSRGVAE